MISFTLPSGFHLMALESVPVRGGFEWNVYIRRNGKLPFKGARSLDLQTAIDTAHQRLLEWETAVKPTSPLSLKINLKDLGL